MNGNHQVLLFHDDLRSEHPDGQSTLRLRGRQQESTSDHDP